ncbi:MAG: dihydropteroate synthase [Deltaproteobacteria bacterium]|jgi:dihydropteroate synthase|nr:dihydropteroate synthase [Deltaproteobacteria bacterium]
MSAEPGRASAGLPAHLEWTHPSGRVLRLDFTKPLIMGILNLTPDSFSDGGLFFEPGKAIDRARALIGEGADILDLGAETTRPGSLPTSAEEEWRRLGPVLEALSKIDGCPPVSVDTYKSEVAAKAIGLGASMLNDIYAGRKDPSILKVAAESGVPIVLMHMQGEPRTMQADPHYDDVVTEVRDFLLERAKAAEDAGVAPSRIILDPGLGFGKNRDHNLSLLRHFDTAMPREYRAMMALSRKAFLGQILGGAAPGDRDLVTAVASSFAVLKGADIVRVHNVAPTREALLVAREVMAAA